MDDLRFDRIARVLGEVTTRRTALLGGASSALVMLGHESVAKKKKKCKKPKVKCGKKCCAAGLRCINGVCAAPPPPEECDITKTATLWTLEADCTITKTIQIPNGVTFDGNDKTITMTGNVANYVKNVPDNWIVAAGVLANGGSANVHDLTIRGSNLTGSCSPTAPEGLAFINASGDIENVTTRDVRLQGASACGVGISATGTGGQTVAINDVVVSGSGRNGVWGLTRPDTAGITINVDGATVDMDANALAGSAGVLFSGGRISGTIANADVTTISGVTQAIVVVGRGAMTGQIVNVTDATIVAEGAGIGTGIFTDGSQSGTFTVNVTRADITCTGDPATSGASGITYSSGGTIISGTVDDCVIRDAPFAGIEVLRGDLITIKNSTIEDGFIGIYAAADVDAQDNTITGALAGIVVGEVDATVATLTDNTIVGRGETPDLGYGILFNPEASGSVNGNTISNFFDSDDDTTSCGIGVFDGAGTVTIGTNTFPDPPGNEEDICLDIPMARRRAGRHAREAFGIDAKRGRADLEQSLALTAERYSRDRLNAQDGGKHRAGRKRKTGKR